MNFGFDAEQLAMRETAERLLAAQGLGESRLAECDPDSWRPQWATIVELGWPAMAVPGLHEGLGLGVTDLVALAEVTGRWLLCAPWLSVVSASVLAAGADLTAMSSAIVAGEVVVPVWSSAPEVSWDGRRLRGRAHAVADAGRASHLVVVAHGPEGFVMAGVNVSSVTVIPLESVDPSRPCVDVVIDTELDPALVRSFDAAEAQDVARVVLAAELVGVVDRLIELTADHARSRSQFDRPIGAFQAVKHRLADLYVALERARSLTYAAAMTLDDDDESRSTRRAAALAKAAASEVAVNAARSAVQLHGAMAITWEHDVHLLARRARHGALWLGDARTQYERAARLALDEAS